MKKVMEVRNEIREEINGKVGASFKKSDYERMAKAFINDIEFTTEVVKTRKEDGTITKETIQPVKDFRNNVLKPILTKFGVDAVEAEKINEIEIDKVKGLYEFQSELNYEFMQTGRKLDFLPKEDFKASMFLYNESGSTKEHKMVRKDKDGNRTESFTTVIKEDHVILKVKSTCPKNKKKKAK